MTEEVCRLLGLRTAVLHRFEDARTSTIVGKFGEPTGPFEVGNDERARGGLGTGGAPDRGARPVELRRARRPGRRPSCGRSGSGRASACRSPSRASRGVRSSSRSAQDETLPLETERRLQAFAELVGLAVASAQARDELAASRLRIVEASDTERRRIERNLHDGAQQRLVALSLGLRVAHAQAAERRRRRPRSCSRSSRASSRRR